VTPFSITPQLITYSVRGNLIVLVEMVAEMDSLEQVCIHFLDSFPTVDRSLVRYNNRVFRENCDQGSGIIVIISFGALSLGVDSFFWAKVGKAKLIANPTTANSKRIFISVKVLLTTCKLQGLTCLPSIKTAMYRRLGGCAPLRFVKRSPWIATFSIHGSDFPGSGDWLLLNRGVAFSGFLVALDFRGNKFQE
jgi:hypothetical protein